MATSKQVQVPNIGEASDVEVIEVLVKSGDKVKKDDSLITLESDKASMEIPAPYDGEVDKIEVKVGDKVSEGSVILTLRTDGKEQAEKPKNAEQKKTAATEKVSESSEKVSEKSVASSSQKEKEEKVVVPDIGDASAVEVIEVLVKPGDVVKKDDSLITLESEKASMEIPAPFSGKIKSLAVKLGDKVSQGDAILTLVTSDKSAAEKPSEKTEEKSKESVQQAPQKEEAKKEEAKTAREEKPVEYSPSKKEIHAGPAVRRLAREFGIDLDQVKGSGPKQRILKEDVQQFVKSALSKKEGVGMQIAAAPAIDFAKFGEIEKTPLNRIKKLTGVHVHRSWVTVPHVTQFDDADVTEMEEFRKSQKDYAEKHGYKLTPLVFIMKAVVASLKQFPNFNASLDETGENLIFKKYFHLGIAVDTPNGLVVPVIRDVDKKGMFAIAEELANISKKARDKGLSPADMAGSCFTISSLGGIGGTAFTPIVNAPDVAILGVSKASTKPVYKDKEKMFVPRLMLPLSLSYDHRVIDGADGARFMVYLASRLADIRTLLL